MIVSPLIHACFWLSTANGVDDDPSKEGSLDEVGDADGQTPTKSGEVPKVRHTAFLYCAFFSFKRKICIVAVYITWNRK